MRQIYNTSLLRSSFIVTRTLIKPLKWEFPGACVKIPIMQEQTSLRLVYKLVINNWGVQASVVNQSHLIHNSILLRVIVTVVL